MFGAEADPKAEDAPAQVARTPSNIDAVRIDIDAARMDIDAARIDAAGVNATLEYGLVCRVELKASLPELF